MKKIIKMKSLDEKFREIISSKEWDNLQKDFNKASHIYIIGNGGNLAVADHAAIDISRLSKKSAAAPGSGILASSIINEVGFDNWLKKWLEFTFKNKEELNKILIIGITTSSKSTNVFNALNWANERGAMTGILAGQDSNQLPKDCNTIQLAVDYYHTAEVLSLLLFYQLIEDSGAFCPKISNN